VVVAASPLATEQEADRSTLAEEEVVVVACGKPVEPAA
jgi:hypothetical protein